MAEAVFRKLQIGPETTFGTSVAATTIVPVEPGSGYFTKDRATEIPREDVGRIARNSLAARASHGVRLITGNVTSPMCFQNFGHWLEMILGPDVPSGVGPYVHTHTGIQTSDTLVNHTIEFDNDTQDFDVTSATLTRLTMGFSELSAPGNAMWMLNADVQAQEMAKSTATGSLTVPTLETMEGHFTTLAWGDTATAFGSLGVMAAHMIRCEVAIEQARPPRKYGGTTDLADAWGWSTDGRLVTLSMGLKFSATSVTDVHDHFNVAGGVPTARRARLTIDGAGNNVATIDLQLNKIAANVVESNGEIILDVTAEAEYNATLASDMVMAVTNDVATLP